MVITNFRNGMGPVFHRPTSSYNGGGTRKRMRMMDPAYCSSSLSITGPRACKRLRRRRHRRGVLPRRSTATPPVVTFAPAEGVAKDGLSNVRVDVRVFDDDDDENRSSGSNLWWTRAERNEMCVQARRTIALYKREHVDDIEDMLDVFEDLQKQQQATTTATVPDDACAAVTESASAISARRGGEEGRDGNEHDDDDALSFSFGHEPLVVPASARGLEWGFVPSIKAHRKRHMRTVLDMQEDLLADMSDGEGDEDEHDDEDSVCSDDADDDNENDLNDEMDDGASRSARLSVLLGSCAVKSSRPSRVLAHLLGLGDAEQAGSVASGRASSCSSSSSIMLYDAALSESASESKATPPSLPSSSASLLDVVAAVALAASVSDESSSDEEEDEGSDSDAEDEDSKEYECGAVGDDASSSERRPLSC